MNLVWCRSKVVHACLYCVRSIVKFILFVISIVILTRWCRYQTGSLAPIVRWLAVRAQHIMSAPQEPPQIRPNAQPAPGRANVTVLAQEITATRCIICYVAHVGSQKRVRSLMCSILLYLFDVH